MGFVSAPLRACLCLCVDVRQKAPGDVIDLTSDPEEHEGSESPLPPRRDESALEDLEGDGGVIDLTERQRPSPPKGALKLDSALQLGPKGSKEVEPKVQDPPASLLAA